jgi:hypothetical protein
LLVQVVKLMTKHCVVMNLSQFQNRYYIGCTALF